MLRKELPAPALGHVTLMETWKLPGAHSQGEGEGEALKELFLAGRGGGSVRVSQLLFRHCPSHFPKVPVKRDFPSFERCLEAKKKKRKSAHSNVKRMCQKVQCSAVLGNWRTGLRHPSGAGERMAGGSARPPCLPRPTSPRPGDSHPAHSWGHSARAGNMQPSPPVGGGLWMVRAAPLRRPRCGTETLGLDRRVWVLPLPHPGCVTSPITAPSGTVREHPPTGFLRWSLLTQGSRPPAQLCNWNTNCYLQGKKNHPL